MTQKEKEEALVVHGTVTEEHANAQYRVQLASGHEVFAYLSGKIRRYNIRVVLGDQVDVELSAYDLARGRIVYRR